MDRQDFDRLVRPPYQAYQISSLSQSRQRVTVQ